LPKKKQKTKPQTSVIMQKSERILGFFQGTKPIGRVALPSPFSIVYSKTCV
jgi:hypothetical protein